MASTFSTNLALELIGTGDQAGTWGVTTNTNLGTLVEQAISGYVTQAVSTGADTTITIPNGATGVARNMYIELTGTGGTNTNLIVPSNKKLYFIFNNTSSGQVTVKVSGQTGVSVPNGKKVVLVCNGTDIVNGLNYIADFGTNSFTVTNLTASSGTITNLIATTASVSDASATVLRASSATLTHLSATSASITNLALTSLTISSLSITNVSVASATVSSNLTLSGGTANGVLYLNGSKVATSGATFAFDSSDRLIVGAGSAVFGARIECVANTSGDGLRIRGRASDATGILSFGANAAATEYARIQSDNTSALIFGTGASGTEGMRLTSTGLGIGTASPGAKLHVLGSNLVGIFAGTNANTVYTEYRYNSTTTSGFIGNGSSILSAAADSDFIVRSEGALKFATNGNNFRAVIDSSGNLGIGTTSPAYKLDVNGNAQVGNATAATNRTLFINGVASKASRISFQESGVDRWLIGNGAASENGNFEIYDATNGNNFVLTRSGNLGIGVTPSAWASGWKAMQVGSLSSLSDSGAVTYVGNNFYQNASSNNIYLTSSHASLYGQTAGQHIWYTAPSGTAGNTISFTQAMTLNASGNLGVGTTSPADSANFGRALDIQSSTGAAAYFRDSDDTTKFAVAGFFGSDSNAYYGSYGTGTGTLFFTSGSERGRFSAGGDLFVGGTTGSSRLNLQTATNSSTDSNYITLYNAGENVGHINWINGNGDLARITGTKAGTGASANDGILTFSTATDAALTERARITSGGVFEIANGGSIRLTTTASGNGSMSFDGTTFTIVSNSSSASMVFSTNSTERGRFTSAGYFKASNSGTYNSSTSSQHEFYQTDNANALRVTSTSSAVSGAYGLYVDLTADPNATDSFFIRCYGGANQRASIRSNGGLANYQANDVNLSDQRVKKDVKPLGSMWDKFKAIEIVTFKYKDQTHDDDNIGVIAQQVESVAPEFIDVDGFGETPEGEEPLKTVYTTDMYHAAIKALQEAMARIEQLEADMAALKASA